jgi:DNA-binding MarR family transcriptional regulator
MAKDEPAGNPPSINTIAMLGRAYSLLGFQIVDGVIGAGYPQKPKHSAVFAQLGPDGARATELAARAGMTPQAMGELIDELEQLDYVRREPDPADRRAKIVRLTPLGAKVIVAGERVIVGIESDIDARLGVQGHAELRRLLGLLLAD